MSLITNELNYRVAIYSKKYYKFLNGSPDGNDWNTSNAYRKLILADGMQIMFFRANNECTGTAWNAVQSCGYIAVDLNGEKAPNTYGRDVFSFTLKENGLFPCGCESGTCPDSAGFACACKVLREGAMNY